MKDEFVQTVSHELRTPLTYVKGYVEVLSEGMLGDLNDEQKKALNIVKQRTESVVRLVNDIISLTWIKVLDAVRAQPPIWGRQPRARSKPPWQSPRRQISSSG